MHFASEPFEHGSPATCIIPLPSVDAIITILDKTKDVTVSTSATDLVLRTGDVVYSTRLVADHYPSVREMVTRMGPRSAQVTRDDLADALKSALLSTPDGALAGILSLEFTADELIVSGEGQGSSLIPLPLLTPSPHSPLVLSLAAPLLLSALAHLPPTVTLHTDDDLSPLFATSPGHPLTALIMPCRK
jgi:hypothetical protein